ncbi:MAG: hypothetical protein J0I34_18400 [Pseudonocardia sp.]|uniref:hypothetical protein n=1 Tax=unclassified Pseudonocardia TaxID=2619320 RepID=UPI00086E8157|nr:MULTISPECIES: hypothetical protein [unclassified Pseudonocardia]MBN9110737.1 hypothetical protein [Pseudonocardia sp.]ODU27177.1 MAG: hypothetical protein ABS80_04535 [Pseudonocardia sp. SCN 72-51]ODV04520.1 MAG: hypothetical protein ABT15_20925 [Pseudonocardia sp. SCN 73-27]
MIGRVAARIAAGACALVLAGCGGTGSGAGAPTTAPTTAGGSTVAPTTAGPAPTTSAGPTSEPDRTAAFAPLWPFADASEAAAWQREYATGGHQPWHLDPGATALAFAAALGLTGIDQVTSSQVAGDQAWAGVGHALPERPAATAAVVHLVRLGTGVDRPWEVVGTHDTTLTLDTPAYGTAAGSPVAVGGEITGVDESLRVQVRSAGAARPLGDTCCLPAGGERQRWATTVTVHGRGLATIVVSTGGHVAEVERFAVTAVLLR